MRWSTDGDGATEDEIAQAEATFGVAFPPAYRRMLAKHAGGSEEHLEFLIPPGELLAAKDLDTAEFGCLSAWDLDRLALLIPIFRSMSGSYYALDYSAGPVPRVLDLDHEQGDDEGEPHAYESFDAFVANAG